MNSKNISNFIFSVHRQRIHFAQDEQEMNRSISVQDTSCLFITNHLVILYFPHSNCDYLRFRKEHDSLSIFTHVE